MFGFFQPRDTEAQRDRGRAKETLGLRNPGLSIRIRTYGWNGFTDSNITHPAPYIRHSGRRCFSAGDPESSPCGNSLSRLESGYAGASTTATITTPPRQASTFLFYPVHPVDPVIRVPIISSFSNHAFPFSVLFRDLFSFSTDCSDFSNTETQRHRKGGTCKGET